MGNKNNNIDYYALYTARPNYQRPKDIRESIKHSPPRGVLPRCKPDLARECSHSLHGTPHLVIERRFMAQATSDRPESLKPP